MKKCFRCQQEKRIECFYKHPKMADGHLNKCKECCKMESVANRAAKLDYYRNYDKIRLSTKRRKLTVAEARKKTRLLYPEKYKARTAVSNALRSGVLVRKPCKICGNEKSEAHHKDYSKPLDVEWLCRTHHLIKHGNYIQK